MSTTVNFYKFNLLSIEAWRTDGYWTWNQWFLLERDIIFLDGALTTRRILSSLRKWGFLAEYSKGRVTVEYDGYNYVVKDRSTDEPLFALEPQEIN